MANIKQKTIGNSVLLFDQNLFPDISEQMFDASFWQQQDKVTGQAIGRGITTFFCENNRHYVLRHYRRGGLIGKIIQHNYLYCGLTHTRAWAEMQLLNWMSQQQLPVPAPVAARIIKQGLFYQADIILQKIPTAKDAFNLLQKSAFSAVQWQKIGACIKQFHQQQVYHHDLNIHNIMLDEQQQVWLIDFDKCAVRKGENWKNANLSRLQRSLVKERSKDPHFHWQEADWQACLQGYSGKD